MQTEVKTYLIPYKHIFVNNKQSTETYSKQAQISFQVNSDCVWNGKYAHCCMLLQMTVLLMSRVQSNYHLRIFIFILIIHLYKTTIFYHCVFFCVEMFFFSPFFFTKILIKSSLWLTSNYNLRNKYGYLIFKSNFV